MKTISWLPRRKALLSFIICSCAMLFLAQHIHAQAMEARLGHRLDSLLRSQSIRPFNGQVLIARGGQTIYERSIGYADLERKTAFPKHSQYVIGSLTKQITAVLVLQAAEKGLIGLDVPIRKYLPSIHLAWADTVTAHHLLNHTSGYQRKDMPLAFAPGSRFSYSNQAYGLLGELLVAVHGKPYGKLVAQLFKRAGMHHACAATRVKGSKLLLSYSRQADSSIAQEMKTFENGVLPAALLIATPQDIVAWNIALHQKKKLLAAAQYDLMTTPSSKRDHPIFGDVDYGYGIQMTHDDGIEEISHGGYVPGFITVNFYYPASKISMVIMENLDWKDPAFQESFWFEMQVRRLLRESGYLQASH
jgi:D-alanyl-D-alanine carboxypeptidase